MVFGRKAEDRESQGEKGGENERATPLFYGGRKPILLLMHLS